MDTHPPLLTYLPTYLPTPAKIPRPHTLSFSFPPRLLPSRLVSSDQIGQDSIHPNPTRSIVLQVENIHQLV